MIKFFTLSLGPQKVCFYKTFINGLIDQNSKNSSRPWKKILTAIPIADLKKHPRKNEDKHAKFEPF